MLVEGLEMPVGLAVHGDFVYWVDQGLNIIVRVNKFTGQERQEVQGRISHLSDIIAVTPFLMQVRHPSFKVGNLCYECILSGI